MKSLARMFVWWPGMDTEIEHLVATCTPCQMQQSKPPVAPLNPWSWPTRPWTRLHLDFAGPVQGKILIDSHSKWIEVMITTGSTSAIVTQALRTWFAQFGLPEMVVMNNSPGFASEEFEVFLQNNGIKHILSAPYHPSSNGLAERAVQTVKRGLKKNTEGSLTTRLARILFAYRTTPQSTTGVSPAQLLLGRQPRTRLALLRPNIASHVEDKQSQQKNTHDKKARARNFNIGDSVLVRNIGSGQKWVIGMVIQITGPVSYMVRLNDYTIHRCHQDQLRIFRRSMDTDVSLADVPLVDN